jgi:hypothetical protein
VQFIVDEVCSVKEVSRVATKCRGRGLGDPRDFDDSGAARFVCLTSISIGMKIIIKCFNIFVNIKNHVPLICDKI